MGIGITLTLQAVHMGEQVAAQSVLEELFRAVSIGMTAVLQ
ncbi:hypothetical protein [Cryobacterium sp. PH29-G1]|nr:hypothetical protein [Cryobacterium sp. PH29-G1]MDJ0349076.1 hypothetical protein [Cryobacterium sp. PH29-G1]